MKKYLIPALAAMMCSCSQNNADTLDSLLNDVEIISVPKLESINLSRAEKASLDQSTAFSENLFMNALFSTTKDTKGNFMFSPVSTNFALALMANVSDETKASEIASQLGFSSLDDLNETYGKLLRHLSTPEAAGLNTSIANAIWHDSALEADPAIASRIRSELYSEIVSTDFSAPTRLALINGWCKEKTDGMIPQFYNEFPLTQIICVNAFYTWGNWVSPFDKALTAKKPFYGTNGTASVDMMHIDIDTYHDYYATDSYQKIAYPFEGNKASFIVVLPAEGHTCSDIAADAFEHLGTWNYPPVIYKVSFSMPRFELDHVCMLESLLRETELNLEDIDIPLLNIKGQSFSTIKQKTAFKIDEEGIRAAAVTANDTWWANTPREPDEEVEITVDRPFLFFVRDNTTGSIILAGRINNI